MNRVAIRQAKPTKDPVQTGVKKVLNPQRIKMVEAEKSIASISIHKELSKKNDEEKADQSISRSDIKDDFNIHDLSKAWKFVALQYHHFPDFYSTISKYEPELSDNFRIVVFLDNKTQMEEFRDRKAEILGLLRKKLNNYALDIETTIKEANGSRHVYTASEKFEFLKEKNPILSKLKELLDLEIRI